MRFGLDKETVEVGDLKPGDHVYRNLINPAARLVSKVSRHHGIVPTHHGIVCHVPAKPNELSFSTVKVVHWGSHENEGLAIVGECTLEVFMEGEEVLRRARYGGNAHFLDGSYSYAPEQLAASRVVRRAKQILREGKNAPRDLHYRMLYQNCENFATYCKCGISISHQAQNTIDPTGISSGLLGSFH